MFRGSTMLMRITAVIVAALSFSACQAVGQAPSNQSDGDESASETVPVTASGFIEAEEVNVVSEVSGRVVEVLADEADEVTNGQVLVRLDGGLLQAQRAQAQAAVEVAQANLEQLLAGASDEEIAAAEAALEEAEATLAGTQWSYSQAASTVANPHGIDVQITSAETALGLAEQQIELLRAQLEQERMHLDWLNHTDPIDNLAIEFQEYTVQIAESNLRAAEAQYQGAQHELELLQAQRERPLQEMLQREQIYRQIGIAEGQVALQQAHLELVQNGARGEEIAIAEGQVGLAEAQVGLIDAQLAQLTLIAPLDGTITTRTVEPGETASPGVPLLTIANLNVLKLVVYIPETQFGRIQLGAPVEVSVDAYPNQTFEGMVVNIAGKAEFTPQNVQTDEERVNLVFAVKVQIDNVEGLLRPGMPADATFEE
jgi:HlyD family secretion protein